MPSLSSWKKMEMRLREKFKCSIRQKNVLFSGINSRLVDLGVIARRTVSAFCVLIQVDLTREIRRKILFYYVVFSCVRSDHQVGVGDGRRWIYGKAQEEKAEEKKRKRDENWFMKEISYWNFIHILKINFIL